MINNTFLYNYMILRSKPKKHVSKSRAAQMAVKSIKEIRKEIIQSNELKNTAVSELEKSKSKIRPKERQLLLDDISKFKEEIQQLSSEQNDLLDYMKQIETSRSMLAGILSQTVEEIEDLLARNAE